jgi:purine-nucleoside phosphorylase
MAIRRHIKLVDLDGWKVLLSPESESTPPTPYSPRFVTLLQDLEASSGRELLAGTYAALTGPCYETPAEIHALRYVGADAVGMSTAIEAEIAVSLGLEVAGLSCITNQAAGLSDGPLSHAEVEDIARLAVGRVSELFGKFLISL